jgi:hypothetical protein
MSTTQKTIAAIVALLVAVLVVFLMRHHGPAETAQVGTSDIVMPDKISTADHDAYIASAIPSCKTEAAKQPRIIEQHVADSTIADYCKCFAEKSADAITQTELTAIANKTMPPSFMTKVQDIAKGCVAQYLTPTPAPAQ